MKRVRFAAVKKQIDAQLNQGNFNAAYKTFGMYKGMFPHFRYTIAEEKARRAPLENETKELNLKIVDNSLNPLRSNFCWLLPASATLLASTQEPLLIGLGILGTTLGSFGFKKQCGYIANSMIYKQLCDKANTLEKIFESKESELKTK